MDLPQVDALRLHKLWHRKDLRVEDIATQIGVSVSSLRRLAVRYRLGPRPSAPYERMRAKADPTPAEIAERAAECRARRSKNWIDESDEEVCEESF